MIKDYNVIIPKGLVGDYLQFLSDNGVRRISSRALGIDGQGRFIMETLGLDSETMSYVVLKLGLIVREVNDPYAHLY